MKQVSKFLFASLLIAAGALASAQTYPFANPTYSPSAIGPATSYSAPAIYTFDAVAASVVSFQISGTCTGVTATAQVSNNNSTWVTVNVWPVTTGTITAAASVTATGIYRINTTAVHYARLNISALTAACTVLGVGDNASWATTY
jgi:hypothetical protein